jgi:hypothetical protein
MAPRTTTVFAVVLLACAASSFTTTTVQAAAFPEPDAKEVLTALYKVLKITDADPTTCIKDSDSVATNFKNFASFINHKNYSSALVSLNGALSALSTSINGCAVKEVQTKLDAIAAAIKWADVKYADEAVQIFIDATDCASHLSQLAVDITKGDSTAIGNDLGNLINDWSAIAGSCTSDACKWVDGILKIMQVVAQDISGTCESNIALTLNEVKFAISLYNQKNYTGFVKQLATAVDTVAVAFGQDSCQLQRVADVLQPLSAKIAAAIVKDDQIIIGYANIYDDVFQAAKDLANGDLSGFGMEVGKLLQVVRTSNCKTKACTILEGLLESAQLASADFDKCLTAVDQTGTDFDAAVKKLENKQWVDGLKEIGSGIHDLAGDVSSCDVAKLGSILEDMATKLGAGSVAKDIGEVVLVLVDGADVTNEIADAVADYQAGRLQAFGKDLGDIASFLSDTVHCNTFVCKVVEGILDGADLILSDLKQCETDLSKAEDDFVTSFQNFKSHDFSGAVTSLSTGLRTVGTALSDCGLQQDLSFLKHEAALFGIANVTALDKAGGIVSILVHGFDFYDNVLDFVGDIEKHDFRDAGNELQTILDTISKWSTGHVCQSDWCYVVEGIMQAEAIVEGDIRQCEADFKMAFGNFSAAVDLVRKSKNPWWKFEWIHDKHLIESGVRDIGHGMDDVSKGVSDCHLEELSELLTQLAAKLAIPEVGWIAEVLHILVEGVHIEKEIGDACVDWSDKNWVGFGYNLAKLIKTLL